MDNEETTTNEVPPEKANQSISSFPVDLNQGQD